MGLIDAGPSTFGAVRMGGAGLRLARAALLGVVVVAAMVPAATSTGAAAAVPATPGRGVARPRVLYRPGQESVLRARLQREPYRTVFLQMHGRTEQFLNRTIGDHSIGAQRDLSRAAKNVAFEYAADRTVVDGKIVAFPDAASRRYAGALVSTLLARMYTRSRLAVPPPLGGFDRDINTSEEIVNYATAFDTLLGAGFDPGANRAVIVERLSSLAGELYENYSNPDSANRYALLNQNNHRSKSGAALAIAAVVLADEVPAAAHWWNYGALQVDDVLRFMLVAGDGAYGEGPYYYRYTMQNVLPFLRVWDRLLGAASWTVGTEVVPAYLRHPLFTRTFRWMLDTTVPDGTMAPIDDGNPGRSYYFGAVPAGRGETAAGYWRWAGTPQPFDADGSVDLAADTIATYDDTIAPKAPSWSPTQFYVEGGTATFRSGWSKDAVMALALGEHDTASEFGRDRHGVGRAPQSHEHAEPGSFLFHAYGQRLALDPGYLTFTTHGLVNKPEDHNMVLVDGAGPRDYLGASLDWLADPLGRPPADGQATISATLDSDGLDTATVSTSYGSPAVALQRRFLFADDRYLVVSDSVGSAGGSPRLYSVLLHGNGGGTSGGTFTRLPTGGRWEIGGARLDGALAFDTGPPAFSTSENEHEVPYGVQRTHVVLAAAVRAPATRSLQVVYPSKTADPAPSERALVVPGAAALELTDSAGDRRISAARRNGPGWTMVVGSLRTDGSTALLDTHLDGSLRLAAADGATSLAVEALRIVTATRGTLSVRRNPGRADLVLGIADPRVDVAGLGFVPARADGACGWSVRNGVVEVRLNGERRVVLRAAGGNSRPAADAGPDRRVQPGALLTLDGTASCDANGDALTPRWELVSAPAGSAWSLTGATGWNPKLRADRVGPYRVRLIVTDPKKAQSLESEVVVIAGDRGADGVDNDLDGLIDSDDPDADEPCCSTGHLRSG